MRSGSEDCVLKSIERRGEERRERSPSSSKMAAAVMPTSTGLSGGSLETCVAYCQTYVCGGGKASAAAAAASGSFLHHPCNLAAAGVQGLSSSRGDSSSSSSSSCWKEGQSTTTMSRFNGRRRRLQVLQQAAPPTLNSPENVAMKNLQVGPIPGMCVCAFCGLSFKALHPCVCFLPLLLFPEID